MTKLPEQIFADLFPNKGYSLEDAVRLANSGPHYAGTEASSPASKPRPWWVRGELWGRILKPKRSYEDGYRDGQAEGLRIARNLVEEQRKRIDNAFDLYAEELAG
jgi:hypothetical protein